MSKNRFSNGQPELVITPASIEVLQDHQKPSDKGDLVLEKEFCNFVEKLLMLSGITFPEDIRVLKAYSDSDLRQAVVQVMFEDINGEEVEMAIVTTLPNPMITL